MVSVHFVVVVAVVVKCMRFTVCAKVSWSWSCPTMKCSKVKEAAKFTSTEMCFLLISKYCLKNVEVSDNVQYRYIYHFNRFFWPKPMSPSPIPFLFQNYGDQLGNEEIFESFLLFSCPQHQWGHSFAYFLL